MDCPPKYGPNHLGFAVKKVSELLGGMKFSFAGGDVTGDGAIQISRR